MIQTPIEDLAGKIEIFIRGKGAERRPEFGYTVPTFVTVEEICFEFHIDRISEWPALKQYMIDHGYPLTYLPGKGHFFGTPGEEIQTDYYKLRTAAAYTRKMPALRRRMQRAAQTNGAAWQHLQKIYGVTKPEDLEKETLKRITPEKPEKDLDRGRHDI